MTRLRTRRAPEDQPQLAAGVNKKTPSDLAGPRGLGCQKIVSD